MGELEETAKSYEHVLSEEDRKIVYDLGSEALRKVWEDFTLVERIRASMDLIKRLVIRIDELETQLNEEDDVT